ncbi:MAG: RDD family protein [Minisyncoccota bacterium]
MPLEQQPVPSALPQVDQVPVAQPQTLPIGYAGFWIRFLASCIDGALLLICIYLIFFLVVLSTVFGGVSLFLQISMNVLQTFVIFAYLVMLTLRKQATFGKKLLGLSVLSENGIPLSFKKVIVRETIGKILSALVIFSGYLMVGFTDKKQALHDKMVGSVVVSTPTKRKTWAVILGVVLAVPVPVLFANIVLASVSISHKETHAMEIAVVQSRMMDLQLLVLDAQNRDGGSYANVCTDAKILEARKEVEVYANATIVCNATPQAYAMYIPLQGYYAGPGVCMDSTDNSNRVNPPGTATSCP